MNDIFKKFFDDLLKNSEQIKTKTRRGLHDN